MPYVILLHVLFTIPALIWLGKRRIEQTPQAIWALILISIPILGVVALVLVRPGESQKVGGEKRAESKFELKEFRRQ